MDHPKNIKKNRYRNKKKEIQTQNNTQNNTSQICCLCKDLNIEICMSCIGMHSYCFNCIKKWLANKKELSCPECRKICDNIIKLPIPKDKLSKEFTKFLESVKIIPNPLKHDEECDCFKTFFENTCIYPNWTIVNFIENEEPLELYYDIIENPKYKDKTDDLIKLIKWFTIDEEDHIHHRHIHTHD